MSIDGAGACIATSAWTAARTAIEALLRPAAEVIDRRPAGFAIDHIGLVGATLSLAGALLPVIHVEGRARITCEPGTRCAKTAIGQGAH